MEVDEPYFSLIKSGKKTIEGRKNSPKWQSLYAGMTIKLTNGSDSFEVKIDKITIYSHFSPDPLGKYLNDHLSEALPNVKTIEEGRKVYLQWSTEEEIAKYGFMAIHVSL